MTERFPRFSKLLSRFGLGLVLAGCASARAEPSDRDHDRDHDRGRGFAEFVAALDRAEPLDPGSAEGLLGRALGCSPRAVAGRVDCSVRDLEIAGMKVGHIDLRWVPGRGSILVLERFDAPCLPVQAFAERFGAGTLGSDCTDGVTCLYRSYRRPWGRLSLGLGGDRAATGCVLSVVLDSFPR